jgi:hypothetical protein
MFYFVIQSSLKMDSKNYLKDISDIKNLMNKSSKFISLSGLSGVLAGIYALIGASYFYFTVEIPKSSYWLLICNYFHIFYFKKSKKNK